MFINKGIQVMSAKISTKNNSKRPQLAGVMFQNGVAYATDSYKLVEVVFNDNITGSEKIIELGNNTDKYINIKSADIKDLKLIKDSKALISTPDDLGIYNIHNDMNTTRAIGIKGEPLEYKKFFNKDTTTTVNLGVEHLLDLLNTYKAFGIDTIQLDLNHNCTNDVINIVNVDNAPDGIKEINSVLMPVNKA